MMSVEVFAPGNEPIVGVPAIAKETGWTERRVRYLIATNEIPTGKIGRLFFTKAKWIAERFEKPTTKAA
jgi:hypothetical protein